MKALVFSDKCTMDIQELNDPVANSDEALIRVKAVGICGSDFHGYTGTTGRRIPPMIMGHEFSGEIEAVGDITSEWKKGDRVVPFPIVYCSECSYCSAEKEMLCVDRKVYGALDFNGAMCEYMAVPLKNLIRISDDISYETAAMIEPLAVAYRGVKSAGDIKGKTVVIIGSGTIGLMALVLVLKEKPDKVIVADVIDKRLALAKELGADEIINSKKEDFYETVLKYTGYKKADVTYEAVGSEITAECSISALKPGGKAVWIGNNDPFIKVNMQNIVTNEIQITGSYMYSFNDFYNAARLVNGHKIDISPIISRICKMEKAASIFSDFSKGKMDSIKVILNP